jgi:hypothetical protein
LKANNDELRKVVDLQRDNERIQKELAGALYDWAFGQNDSGARPPDATA